MTSSRHDVRGLEWTERARDSDESETPPPRAGWRREVVRSGAVTAGVGLWFAVSPWVLNYRAEDATVLAVVLGLVVATLALVRAGPAAGADWFGWLNAAIGVSLVALAFLAPDSRRGLWSFLVAGVAVFASAAWSASPRRAGRR